jgi:hypothetical protein
VLTQFFSRSRTCSTRAAKRAPRGGRPRSSCRAWASSAASRSPLSAATSPPPLPPFTPPLPLRRSACQGSKQEEAYSKGPGLQAAFRYSDPTSVAACNSLNAHKNPPECRVQKHTGSWMPTQQAELVSGPCVGLALGGWGASPVPTGRRTAPAAGSGDGSWHCAAACNTRSSVRPRAPTAPHLPQGVPYTEPRKCYAG